MLDSTLWIFSPLGFWILLAWTVYNIHDIFLGNDVYGKLIIIIGIILTLLEIFVVK